MIDRAHQIAVRQRFREIATAVCQEEHTVLDVCPGGGKSRTVNVAVEELDREAVAGGVIWLVPRASLAAQARKSFNVPGAPFQLRPVIRNLGPSKPFGFVSTYQRFTSRLAGEYALEVAKAMRGRPGFVLMVLDELHHLTDDLNQAWTRGADQLKQALLRHKVRLHYLNMSGTLYRRDGSPILHLAYANGAPVTHVRYSLASAQTEKAIVPPEVVYVDGPVVIRRPSGNEAAYPSMTLVPKTHRPMVRTAFLNGAITQRAINKGQEDGRQFTSLYLLKYGTEHFKQQRRAWNYPLQMIVVAHSASAALGYTSWLRRNHPDLRVGLSLSNPAASHWGDAGMRRVTFPDLQIVGHDGKVYDGSTTVSISESTDSVSTFLDDFQLLLHGMAPATYDLSKVPADFRGGGKEWQATPIGERVIRAFQAPPVDGENLVDVLVTVGKAYEGLDAPRVSHLICLPRHRSAPWLAQCFARAWRYDYGLAAQGVTEQQCWIFVARDKEMEDAVTRIVEDQGLSTTHQPTTPPPDDDDEEVEDDDPDDDSDDDGDDDPDDEGLEYEFGEPVGAVLDDESRRRAYEQWKEQMQQEQLDLTSNPPVEPDTGDGEGDDPGPDPDDDDDGEGYSTPKRGPARAFSIIDRIVHVFVDYRAKSMQVRKDLRLTPEEMLA